MTDSRLTVLLKGFIAGAITGAIETCVNYPTEFLKTQLQLQTFGNEAKYQGVWDCIRKTVQTKGLLGFYRGLTVYLYGGIPKAAIRFGTFEVLKELSTSQGQHTSFRIMLYALGAGATEAIIIVTPLESIKTKYINDQHSESPKYKGIFHCAKTIYSDQGFRGIYQGMVPTIIKQSSNQATRFFIMDVLKKHYRGGDPTKPVPKIVIGIHGFVAGITSVLLNSPADVVKTRMQGFKAGQYNGFFDCIIQIWRKEGFFAFYKGVAPRLTRAPIDVALTFMIYDVVAEIVNKFIQLIQ